ncbi:MAG: trimethylamine methyltransferase family protein, partial [Alphaproteobacteria bacterium]|nr:trimethylamine methyltransferase family protein [Alphaproteobacteria bacterium]
MAQPTASRDNRRRRRGSSDSSDKTATSQPTLNAPNYITRNIPYVELCNEEQLVAIEAQAEWIMEEKGLAFTDSPHALEVWRKAGADVDGVRVRLPRGMAREYCAKAPKQFIQHAKNPAFNVTIGGNHTVFATV